MALWTDAPPEPRTRRSNNPTLLFSWWCTCFSATLILVRICGRKIRVNAFFSEDKVMALSMIPLFVRMGLIHVVLLLGTNNVDTAGLTEVQIREREHGSKIVLAARIFYAMFIWMSKYTVSEFLKRTFCNTWRQSYEWVLRSIRIFLVCTFFAVVVATLGECQPVAHYWQVVPDPGPRCRQGYAQLITMGAANIITDILLVAFPIPIILRAHFPKRRKFCLIMLFSASLLLIGVTGSRVPKVIEARGRQQYRTVWASIEILLSTFVSNAVILGSFLRDTGVKRNKYRQHSFDDSIERAPTHRSAVQRSCDSEEDLFRSLGFRMPKELMHESSQLPRLARPEFSSDDKVEDEESAESSGGRRDSRIDSASRRPDNTRDLVAFLQQSARDRSRPSSVLIPTSPVDVHIADVGGLLRPDRLRTSDLGGTQPSGATTVPASVPRKGHSTMRSPRASRANLAALSSADEQSCFRSDPTATTPVHPPRTSPAGDVELEDIGGLLR